MGVIFHENRCQLAPQSTWMTPCLQHGARRYSIGFSGNRFPGQIPISGPNACRRWTRCSQTRMIQARIEGPDGGAIQVSTCSMSFAIPVTGSVPPAKATVIVSSSAWCAMLSIGNGVKRSCFLVDELYMVSGRRGRNLPRESALSIGTTKTTNAYMDGYAVRTNNGTAPNARSARIRGLIEKKGVIPPNSDMSWHTIPPNKSARSQQWETGNRPSDSNKACLAAKGSLIRTAQAGHEMQADAQDSQD